VAVPRELAPLAVLAQSVEVSGSGVGSPVGGGRTERTLGPSEVFADAPVVETGSEGVESPVAGAAGTPDGGSSRHVACYA
jgi:hypothetical protein